MLTLPRSSSVRPHRSAALLAGLALGVASLTGCGAASDKAGEKLTEKAIEDATGGEVDIDAEDGSYTHTDKDGNTTSVGTGELPEGFPDDLPMPAGDKTIVSSVVRDGETAVMMEIEPITDGAAEKDRILSELEAAGYTVDDHSLVDGSDVVSIMVTAHKDGNDVQITWMSSGPDSQAMFVISPSA